MDDTDRYPPEPLISGAKTLVRNGLMQTDMDAQGYRILNLNTSNLILDELPSQSAPAHQWFRSYDEGTHTFGSSRPTFVDLGGNLTLSQQAAITRVGRIIIGEWHATPLDPSRVPVLSSIRQPTGSVTMAHHKITDLDDPVDDEDAVNKRFFDLLALGLHPKAAVRVATTGITTLAGLHHVDGVMVEDNDRVLVKNQTANKTNGIYLAHPGVWTRTTDSDTCADQETATCFVLEGDTQAASTWLQTTPIPVPCNLSDTPWVWVLLSRSNLLQAGAGLDLDGLTLNVLGTANRISVGTTVDIDVAYVGQGSITHLGVVDTGTWESDVITGEFGGTGVNNVGKSIQLSGNFSTAINQDAPQVDTFLHFLLSGSTTLTLPIIGTVATLNGDEILTHKHISADQIDSGVLLISHGGTSANTAVAAIKNLLPDVTGHAGQSLHTDGADVFYWA